MERQPEQLKPRKVQTSATCSDEEIGRILREEKGLQYITAERLGLSGAAISERIDRSPYLQHIRNDCKEKRIDVAEKALSKLNETHNMASIQFFLRTQAKKRGYVDNAPIAVDKDTSEMFLAMMKYLKGEQDAGIQADQDSDTL
jgi:predicted transcriptional regulator